MKIFTIPLSMPDLPYQGVIKVRSIKGPRKYESSEPVIEYI